MFVDEVVVKLFAGAGGDGCTSFRREWCEPMGGPDGGNGGKGASIIFEGDKSLKTLVDLRYRKMIKADKGINGKGSNKYGAARDDVVVKVPLGTTVTDVDTGLIVADIVHDKERVEICKGGRGGRGNKAFATHSEPAPNFSEKGEPGEERIVKCELKLIADIGLIGMPSVGKSTILSMISAAKPKIASYHFTTLNPNIGVVKMKDGRSFTIADLPGLIKGASEGIGLGIKFLKHASRARVLAHVVDMGASEGRNPIEDYETIVEEIKKYDESMYEKQAVVIANKMDLPNARDNVLKFKKAFPEVTICEISAATNTGIDDMLKVLANLLENLSENSLYKDEQFENHVLYKFKEELPFIIENRDGVWCLKGDKIEKLFKMTRFETDEGTMRFARKLKAMGVEDELEKLGAKRGDEVDILGYSFTFKE